MGVIPGERNAAGEHERALPRGTNGIGHRDKGEFRGARERGLHSLINDENVRQDKIIGTHLHLAQMCAQQHRRQSCLELHGRAQQRDRDPDIVQACNGPCEIGDHAVEARGPAVFQPIAGHDDQVYLAVAEEALHLRGEIAAGSIALRRRVQRRHASRLCRLKKVDPTRNAEGVQAGKIVRGKAVAPQQPVGLA